jgi:hypothetical protein
MTPTATATKRTLAHPDATVEWTAVCTMRETTNTVASNPRTNTQRIPRIERT